MEVKYAKELRASRELVKRMDKYFKGLPPKIATGMHYDISTHMNEYGYGPINKESK